MISLFVLTVHADIISFYKDALKTVQYDKSYMLYEQSNKISQDALAYTKFANFSADLAYSKTGAKRLPTAAGEFATTDLSLHDTVDIFGKNNYKIHLLHLDKETKKAEQNLKKEQLFISLANMIALYNRTLEQLDLQQSFYNEQKKMYQVMKNLVKNGNMTALDVLRFKNRLTSLHIKIISQTFELEKMKKQLQLYAPKKEIPLLDEKNFRYTKKDFLTHNPIMQINKLDANKLIAQSKGLKHSYIPIVDVGMSYQKLDDPTSYGDNYSFGVSLQIPLNSGYFKEAQALKVAALSKKTKSTEYQIQRENEYIGHHQAYLNAHKQLLILQTALKDYETSEGTIQKAYLKQYVDFNTYIQVLLQALHVKEQIIAIQSKQELEATILNSIASGAIYE